MVTNETKQKMKIRTSILLKFCSANQKKKTLCKYNEHWVAITMKGLIAKGVKNNRGGTKTCVSEIRNESG